MDKGFPVLRDAGAGLLDRDTTRQGDSGLPLVRAY